VSELNADTRSNGENTPPDVPDLNLLRPVGSGGFGEVWLATNRTTRRLRAVKLIPLQASGNADPAAREISSITRLEANSRCRHPNLLQIHHVGKTAQYLFYVMDPADDVSGEPASDKPDYQPSTLQTRLEGKCGKADKSNSSAAPEGPFRQLGPVPFPPDVCLDYTRQLLSGLAMLHSAGMVHRDVKPANCLFVGGQLKLADFGLLTEAHPLVSRVGTQKYMPPDGRMDMRADVYAAGLVIYEMLTGLPVEEFPRLGAESQRISDSPILTGLLRLALRACERESEKRPADARAMLAELAEADGGIPQPPRRRLAIAICSGVVLAVVGVGGWMLRENAETRSTTIPERAGEGRAGETLSPSSNRLVDVSFVTEPFEAKIYVDGELLRDRAGVPCTTPCTVNGLPARMCRVAFECEGGARWDAGAFDLAKTQQIVSKRP
jgi:eukaryotic-like serine/threonine-protein kinase